MLAGALAGLVTAILNVRFKILHLLASILTMIALFSVNLRIMGRPNVAILIQDDRADALRRPRPGIGLSDAVVRPLFVLVVVVVVGGAAGALPDQRIRPRDAGDRRQSADGAGAGHLDRAAASMSAWR